MAEQDMTMTRAQRMAGILAGLDRLLRADAKRGKGVPLDLTLAQSQVLAYVAQVSRPSQAAVAGHLHVTGPTIVRIVDALERKGLVTRTRGRPDRRLVRIALTTQGAQVQQDDARRQERRLARILDRLPARAVDALIRDLSTLLAGQDDRRAGS